MSQNFNRYIRQVAQEASDPLRVDTEYPFVSPAPSATVNRNIPAGRVPDNKQGTLRRNIITWFVPEIGSIEMYVNPNRIAYKHSKIINKDMTRGGFTLQYFGEDLTTLSIGGTTGSSGVEGINVLYNVYRAEQYAFDTYGMMLADSNAYASPIVDALNGLGNSLTSIFNTVGVSAPTNSIGGTLGNVLGLTSTNNLIAAQNIPSLAQFAFTLEMYYDGVIYRGYLANMSVTEAADNFNWNYDLEFVVTQTRGYRNNYFPWHRSATHGASKNDTPYSINGNVKVG